MVLFLFNNTLYNILSIGHFMRIEDEIKLDFSDVLIRQKDLHLLPVKKQY